MAPTRKNKLYKMYKQMESYFGDLKWWPADSDFEVVVGAVLTQNTAWRNVELAIEGLKKHGLMNPVNIKGERAGRLARIIRSSGYHRRKSARLKEVSRFILEECNGDLRKMRKKSTEELRNKFLSVNGIGPETADSILVYALRKPVFVVDSYTKRIFSRHGLIPAKATYAQVQSLVHENFPKNVNSLNQFHALLVETGKGFCKKKRGICDECPLGKDKRSGG